MKDCKGKENLAKHVQHLCNELNNAGIYTDISNGPWKVRNNPKRVFGGGICFNDEAFYYLKSKGMIDIGVCWKCGREPISNDYTFTLPDAQKTYPICEKCYSSGKNMKRNNNDVNSGSQSTIHSAVDYTRFNSASLIAVISGILAGFLIKISLIIPVIVVVFFIVFISYDIADSS